MIESSIVQKDKNTGIIIVTLRLTQRWVEYQINRSIDIGRLNISFFYDVEEMPGVFGEFEEKDSIKMWDDFNAHDYHFTSMIDKDEISIIAIPYSYLTNNFEII